MPHSRHNIQMHQTTHNTTENQVIFLIGLKIREMQKVFVKFISTILRQECLS